MGGSGSPGHVHTCRPPAPDADPKVTTAQEGGSLPLSSFLSALLRESSAQRRVLPTRTPHTGGKSRNRVDKCWDGSEADGGEFSRGPLSPPFRTLIPLSLLLADLGLLVSHGDVKAPGWLLSPCLVQTQAPPDPSPPPPPPPLTFPAPPPQLSHPFPACSFSPVPCSPLWPLPQPRIPGGAGKNGPAHPPPLPA